MLSALCWVPKGVAKGFPDNLSEGEDVGGDLGEDVMEDGLDEVETEDEDEGDAETDNTKESQIAQAKALAATMKGSSAGGHFTDLEAAMADLDMDHYDSEEEGAPQGVFGTGLPGLAAFVSSKQDPYLARGIPLADDNDDDDSSEFDVKIKDTDIMLVGARHEDDVSALEVWVFEEEDERGQANLYPHHEVLLPAMPLCLAWMDCRPSSDTSQANMVAVGSLLPGIEIWDLDDWEAVQPVATLGGEESESAGSSLKGIIRERKRKEKSKKTKRRLKEGSHTDAVLGLAWSGKVRNVLASASADKTVKVWDVAQQACVLTLKQHAGKVQAVRFNPEQETVLLSGSYDSTVVVTDLRDPGTAKIDWQVPDEVEALAWAPQQGSVFLVSCQNGEVVAFDARRPDGNSGPLYRLAAHDKPTCALSFCPAAVGLLCTASTDKKVKLWDVGTGQPSLLASQNPGVGAVFNASFCNDAPNLIACGGDKASITVWDVLSSAAVAKKFGRDLRRS